MKMKNLFVIPVLMGILMCSGCWALWLSGGAVVGVGAGIAGTAYVKGNLEAHVKQNPIEIAKATEGAFKTLGIKQISIASSKLDSEVIGRTAKDDKIKVTAEVTEDGGSDLSIRIGWFGDEIQSRQIYNEILKQLPSNESGK